MTRVLGELDEVALEVELEEVDAEEELEMDAGDVRDEEVTDEELGEEEDELVDELDELLVVTEVCVRYNPAPATIRMMTMTVTTIIVRPMAL
jgi:hypothetical protein